MMQRTIPIQAVLCFLEVRPQKPIRRPIKPLMMLKVVMNEPSTHQTPRTRLPIAPPLADMFSRFLAIGVGTDAYGTELIGASWPRVETSPTESVCPTISAIIGSDTWVRSSSVAFSTTAASIGWTDESVASGWLGLGDAAMRFSSTFGESTSGESLNEPESRFSGGFSSGLIF